MFCHETSREGADVIELDRRGDERDFLARVFCARDPEDRGLDSRIVRIDTSRRTM
jgi:dTDP-4-dehydrorhamnose 3,5-epimerase-like enzyme